MPLLELLGLEPWVSDGMAWGLAHSPRLRVILALQALVPVHLGIGNQNVCNRVGRLLDGWSGPLLSSALMVTCFLAFPRCCIIA